MNRPSPNRIVPATVAREDIELTFGSSRLLLHDARLIGRAAFDGRHNTFSIFAERALTLKKPNPTIVGAFFITAIPIELCGQITKGITRNLASYFALPFIISEEVTPFVVEGTQDFRSGLVFQITRA